MNCIADLHIHSRFSMATAANLTPEWLDFFARVKGIQLIGTGDFTHPEWRKELLEKLQPAANGLFSLKKEFRIHQPWVSESDVFFILTSEISSIYKKAQKTRKVHTIIMVSEMEIAEKIASSVQKLGYNTRSDGRPITGIDAETVASLAFDASDKSIVFPAHVWTPWFSALGANSGFDSIEECYGICSDKIHALETGLSSDSVMNRMCTQLDKYILLSNSDAHSPEKIGRNATIIKSELDYFKIFTLFEKTKHDAFSAIDLFPQEGKYHFAGHRACCICLDPVEVLSTRGLCPKCGKHVTLGVMDRLAMLADRDEDSARDLVNNNQYIIPLRQILAEIYDVGESTKTIDAHYQKIIAASGSELSFLLNTSIDVVQDIAGEVMKEAIRRMRAGQVHVIEGYDGEYGKVSVFASHEVGESRLKNIDKETRPSITHFDLKKYNGIVAKQGKFQVKTIVPKKPKSAKPQDDPMQLSLF